MNIAILGCGWLGLPLAKKLLQEGHTVKGSTTSAERLRLLSLEGIAPYQIKVSPEGITGDLRSFLIDVEVLIVDFPPGLRKDPEKDFSSGIASLVQAIERSGVKKVVFVSTTSVYEDTEHIPVYTEKDTPNGSSQAARQMIAAERIVLNGSFTSIILRFGGLLGPDRHPVKFLAGRKGLSDAMAPVNLIHQADGIGIILKLLGTGTSGGVYHGVYPEHPLKKEYYRNKAEEAGLPLPEFDATTVSEGKIVRSNRVEEELGYFFKSGIY